MPGTRDRPRFFPCRRCRTRSRACPGYQPAAAQYLHASRLRNALLQRGEATKAARKWRRRAVARCENLYQRHGAGWARAVLYNEFMLLRSEATVIEHLILGAFLVIPLLIVTFLFSDELWQEHRHLHDKRPVPSRHRRIDWRHPLRRARHRL